MVWSKRLAKISSCPNGAVLSSYQVVHGTVRPAPAKSIDGASPSLVWSKLSEPRKVGLALEAPFTVPTPWVTQAPPLNARTNICCSPLVCFSKIVHGTAGPPASSEPLTASTAPASFLGPMPAAASLSTREPLAGRFTKARAAAAATSTSAASAATVAPRRTRRCLVAPSLASVGLSWSSSHPPPSVRKRLPGGRHSHRPFSRGNRARLWELFTA